MEIPKDLKYAKTHEWVRVEGDVAYIGISDYAQEELGDIVYVEMPSAGDSSIRVKRRQPSNRSRRLQPSIPPSPAP